MSILLTEQEVVQLADIPIFEYGGVQKFARAIQLALIEKMRKEPEAYKFSAPGISKLDVWPHGGKWFPLYRLPTPQELEES